VLSTEGLNRYDKDCVYDNLDYFKIDYPLRWDYSIFARIENIKLIIYLQLQDGRLCGSTSDNSICIYNMDTNIIERSMEQLNDSKIQSIIQLKDGCICSCSDDNTVKLWNIESGLCTLSLEGHTKAVYCVIQLVDGRLCSGSTDGTMRVWNKNNGACELSLDTYFCPYPIVQLRDGRICMLN
jgi:WD40 repeat protein